MEVNIKDKTVIELKAMVYDEIGKLEVAKRNITALNQEIAERTEQEMTAITEKGG